jgi:hypothetical protein
LLAYPIYFYLSPAAQDFYFHRLSVLLYFRLPAEHEFMKPNVVFHGQRQLTIDEECSLPENFHFPIIDDLEVKVDLDRGSLPVYFTA